MSVLIPSRTLHAVLLQSSHQAELPLFPTVLCLWPLLQQTQVLVPPHCWILPLSLHCGQALPRHPTKYLTKCWLFWTGLKPAHLRKPSEPVTNLSLAYDRQWMGV